MEDEKSDKKKSPKSKKRDLVDVVDKFISSKETREKIQTIANKIKTGKNDKKEQIFNIVYTVQPELEDDLYSEDEEDYEESEESEESEETESESEEEVETRWKDDDILQFLITHQTNDPKNKTIQSFVDICNEQIAVREESRKKRTKKLQDKNTEIFKKLLRNKQTNDDVQFFSQLETNDQEKHIVEMKKINDHSIVKKPYKIWVIESDIPASIKSTALKKIHSLQYMDPSSGEYHKLQQWVEGFMNIPFNIHKSLEISMSDGQEKCAEFMENSRNILDNCVYGLNDAKLQIMQMLAQFISNPISIGNAIALHGPMGTGKTTLVKEGISKIFKRPFAFIGLGGASDASFIDGHSFTYEGSSWGKIVQTLIQSKCMNPVIFFDELDKISDTPKGDEIVGILTHLTDTTQNTQFHDKFFNEIDFDMSKCLFIFSYNDESKINPILRDRMYCIKTKGYSKKDKIVIVKNHLYPQLCKQISLRPEDILIDDSVIDFIIDSKCAKEEGVRNLKRCIETILTKINLYRLMTPGTQLFDEKTIKIDLPYTVTREFVSKVLPTKEDVFRGLYV